MTRHLAISFGWILVCLVAGAVSSATAGETPPAPPGDPLDFRQVINHAKDKVFPAVVFVKCVQENYDGGQRTNRDVVGSGVIISDTGEFLTNWHVVDKAVEVRCLLSDGRAFTATIIGSDKDTDLALGRLQVPAGEEPIPFATIGDSTSLVEGDFVMAMGAPWGLSRSVSIGIVSCTRRYLPETSEYSLWLQTDASISPGNSGGPLVNTAGQVIGINARGSMAGGDLGFAIPSETVLQLLPRLREHGQVQWMFSGLQLQPLKDFNRNMYFDGTEGVIVADTDPDSPARTAGIQPRDRILAINEEPAVGLTDEDLPAVRRRLGLLPPEVPVRLRVRRNGEERIIEMLPRDKGKTQGEELACPRWDLTIKTINRFDNPNLFFHRETGVFVHGIKSPGNAAQAGLQEQDIILSVNGQTVETIDQVRDIHEKTVANLRNQRRIILTVLRNGSMRQVAIDLSRDFSKD